MHLFQEDLVLRQLVLKLVQIDLVLRNLEVHLLDVVLFALELLNQLLRILGELLQLALQHGNVRLHRRVLDAFELVLELRLDQALQPPDLRVLQHQQLLVLLPDLSNLIILILQQFFQNLGGVLALKQRLRLSQTAAPVLPPFRLSIAHRTQFRLYY